MTKQDRATVTRAALVEAAAVEFARDGYAGVSLGRVSRAAGLSNGALTFHFRSKADLADAVVDSALAAVRASVGEALSAAPTPLARLSQVVTGITRTLHTNAAVRAAARLELDHSAGLKRWSSAWHPQVRQLAEEASRAGELPAGTRPEDVCALAVLFIRAVALHTRAHPAPPDDLRDQQGAHVSLAQYLRLWAMACGGLTP